MNQSFHQLQFATYNPVNHHIKPVPMFIEKTRTPIAIGNGVRGAPRQLNGWRGRLLDYRVELLFRLLINFIFSIIINGLINL
jgi:hypothetical protein